MRNVHCLATYGLDTTLDSEMQNFRFVIADDIWEGKLYVEFFTRIVSC